MWKKLNMNLVLKSCKLRTLNLIGIQLNEEIAKNLSESLIINKSLERLQMSFCIYSQEVMRALLPGMSGTTSVQTLDLSGNRFSDDDLDYLILKLIRN